MVMLMREFSVWLGPIRWKTRPSINKMSPADMGTGMAWESRLLSATH